MVFLEYFPRLPAVEEKTQGSEYFWNTSMSGTYTEGRVIKRHYRNTMVQEAYGTCNKFVFQEYENRDTMASAAGSCSVSPS